jgi:hypothetical protein
MTRDTWFRLLSSPSALFIIIFVGAAFWLFNRFPRKPNSQREERLRSKEEWVRPREEQPLSLNA